MNYRSILTTLLISLTQNNTHCAEYAKFGAMEWLFRYIVLAEPQAEHSNPHAWRIDDTRDIRAMACVEKDENSEWNKLYKKYITDPRKQFAKTHKEIFSHIYIDTLLFNHYGQVCCVARKDQRFKALFGPALQPSVVAIGGGLYYGRPKLISSATITYYDRCQQKKCSHAFQMKYENSELCLVLPDEKERYMVSFKRDYSGGHVNLISCNSTLNKIVQATFDLSEDPGFWNYTFKKNGVSSHRELNCADISVDLKDPYFTDACSNLSALNSIKKSFEEGSCYCGTNYIDPECQEKYKNMCNLLAKEDAHYHLKKTFLIPFAQNHIRHKICYTETIGSSRNTVYADPCGNIYELSSTPFKTTRICGPLYLYTPLSFDINSLQSDAEKHAHLWHQGHNCLYNEKSTTYQTKVFTFICKNTSYHMTTHLVGAEESITDCAAVFYNNRPFAVAALSSNDDPDYGHTMIASCDSNKRLSADQTLNMDGLVNKFITLLMQPAHVLFNDEVRAQKKDIATFMTLIKRLPTPLTNIHDIVAHYEKILKEVTTD